MKRIDVKQVRSWCQLLLAGGLLAGLAPSAQSGLIGLQWTTAITSGDGYGAGTFVFDENSGILEIKSPVAVSGRNLNYDLTASGYNNTEGSVSFNFSWTVDSGGSSGQALAVFLDTSGFQTFYPGLPSGTITVNPGQTINFDFSGEIIKNGPGEVATLNVNMVPVPEAGNALAGLLVLGAAGFEWFRRKRTAGV